MNIFYVDIIASHYRKAIFQLMETAYNMTFLFGKANGSVKSMDTSSLNGKVLITDTLQLWKGWYWQRGVISKLFNKYDFYILNGESRSLSAWGFCVIACILGKRNKVYFWSHGWYGKESIIEGLVKKILFKMPGGGIFLYGDYARNLMIKEGFNSKKLFVIHNSLDYDKQLALRKKMNHTDVYTSHFSNNNRVIIVIGRLNERKKLDLLLTAAHDLNKQGEKYNIVFVGEGDEREKLESLTNLYGLRKQVWFYGACYDEAINGELIYNADVCVMPGDIGLTAIHCLSFGTPCITHDGFPFQGPEFEAIIPGVTGEFYKQGNQDSLTETIKTWFSSHHSREEIRISCYKEIDEKWTPLYQMEVLKRALGE